MQAIIKALQETTVQKLRADTELARAKTAAKATENAIATAAIITGALPNAYGVTPTVTLGS